MLVVLSVFVEEGVFIPVVMWEQSLGNNAKICVGTVMNVVVSILIITVSIYFL